MPTRRGWGTLVASVGFVGVGRFLGVVELYLLGVACAALVAGSLAFVRLREAHVRVDRSLHPPRVHAGSDSRVELDLRNVGNRRTPVLSVDDAFDRGERWARFLVPPLAPGEATRAAYRLPTDRRGVYDIGPLEVVLSDPFSLCSTRTTAAGVSQLTVYPRIDLVRALPTARGQDPHSGTQRPRALLGAGEDFYALRQYEVGDDLRRVHWKSTARLDELMIRQDEMPWQTRLTILLDVRASVHDDESLELAVSAAASIHDASRRRQSLIRLVSTDGTDSGFAAGTAHDEAILEHLAGVGASRHDRLAGVTAALRRAGNGGSLAVVTSDRATRSDIDAVARLAGRYGTIVLVVVERSAYERSAPLAAPGDLPTVGTVVRVNRDQQFGDAWERAVRPDGNRLHDPTPPRQ
ncbi:MAG TPA: DUF58 domain-containing protein [Acidimicrobiales bacterium]|nr:DUF58 domain-containing protein [Acidimicrobiales bacterium]